MSRFLRNTVPALLTALVLAACGGGGGGDNDNDRSDGLSSSGSGGGAAVAQASGTATEGLEWFNQRRLQIGLQPVARNALIDKAAQDHSDYQSRNDTITHNQTRGLPGFTGVDLGDRLTAAGYAPGGNGFAYGEVISSTSSSSGISAAEDLIAAIYHRFVIFEPRFKEAGAGASTAQGGNTYFTTNFTANGLDSGLGSGNIVVYPYSGQQQVPRNFMSDNEAPDPVPDRNEVGYPISIHADLDPQAGTDAARTIIVVQDFSVRPRGGSALTVRQLNSATDRHTASSGAAIVPLEPLAAGTTYDVQFNGLVDNVPVTREWSFTTQ